MTKSKIFIIAGVLYGVCSGDSWAEVRRIRLCIEGNCHTCYRNSDGDIFCNQNEDSPAQMGTLVCSKYIEYEYFDCDPTSEDCEIFTTGGQTYCIGIGDCTPGNSTCYNGTRPFKLCSEWSFTCEEIVDGPMEKIDYINDTFTCIQGYYRDKMECKRCPSSGGVYGTTKSSGATSITECYIPSGTEFSDSSGTWEYGQNCHYSE